MTIAFPDVIRQAQKRDVFWRDFDEGYRWLYALVEEGSTVAGLEGTFYQALAINSEFITRGDERRLVPIEAAPPVKT